MSGNLNFEGMVMDTNNKDLTQQEIQTAMAYQNGFPGNLRSRPGQQRQAHQGV
jgi:hypothetical protein